MKAAGQLVFQVLDLPAEGMALQGEVAFADLEIEADGVFAFPAPLRYDLTVAPVQDGVLVRGRLEAEVERACDRCLETATVSLAVPDVCHHLEHVAGSVVDLTESVREDILLSFPQAWICRPDCRGLCPHCGGNRNESDCGCERADAETDADAPWRALDDLRLRDES
jgi:uncharacterized protein